MDDVDLEEPQEKPLYVRAFWGGLRWGGIAAVVVAVLYALGWIYGEAKVFRAHYLVREAADLTKQHKDAEAQSNIRAAYTLDPRDRVTVRAAADYNRDQGDEGAVPFYHLLVGLPGVTRDDQRDAVSGFLAFGDIKSAANVAARLLETEPQAKDYALQAQVSWATGETKQALGYVLQALALEPDNRADELLAAHIRAQLPDPEQQVEAMNALRELAQGKDATGLEALEIIARNPRLDPATIEWTMEQLRAHPLVDDPGRLAAWGLEKGLGKRDPSAVFKDVVDFYKPRDASSRSVAARWLYSQSQPDLVLELAPIPEAATNVKLLLIRLDALALMQNWKEVQEELSKDDVPLSKTLLYLYRARAADGLGEAQESATNWDKARAEALETPGMLAYLGQYAVKAGLTEEARKTYAQMSHIPADAQAGFMGLLQVESQYGTDAETLETLSEMEQALPSEPEPKNDRAYLSLLLNVDVSLAQTTAQALVAAHPEMLAYRSTLALSDLRTGDAAGALSVYDGLNIDWSTVPASWRMVYAVVLSVNGKKDEAAAMAKTVNRAQLRPVEQVFFRSYFPITP